MRFFARSDNLERRFNREVLPHLDSAYNLARWLLRNDDDAKDAVQEACVKAFQHLGPISAPNVRTWFLAIVRNTALTTCRRNSVVVSSFEDEEDELEYNGPTPEKETLRKIDRDSLIAMIEELPAEFREVIVLKELEELAYAEIAEVAGIPIGTVMSRLNRARQRLRQQISDHSPEEWRIGL